MPPVTLTAITVSNGQISLQWTGGRPTYQLQTRGAFSAPGVNLGSPTSNNGAVVSVSGPQAFFRVVSDYTARYRVVFIAAWSQQTHPTNWPTGAHFSGLFGGPHNASVHFWRDGETANEGLRLMAELGSKTTLLHEIALAIANGTAHFHLSGGGISPIPGSVLLVFPQAMRRGFPLVTHVSLIAPSPDWFVGVDSWSLVENERWLASKVVTLYGKDAGTDSGLTYTSPHLITVPRGGATQFTGFPAIQDGVIVPFGIFTFTRLD